MSSTMVDGVYYSRMIGKKFLWAFVDNTRSPFPAHFGGKGLYSVMGLFLDQRKYAYMPSVESYLVVPVGMIKWSSH